MMSANKRVRIILLPVSGSSSILTPMRPVATSLLDQHYHPVVPSTLSTTSAGKHEAGQARTTKPLAKQQIRELSSNASQGLWQRRNVVLWVSLLSGAAQTHQDKSAGCSDVFVVVMGSMRAAHVDATPRERTHGQALGEGGI